LQIFGNGPYQRHALACNQHYLEALTPGDDPTPGYDDLKILTEPKRAHGRSSAGFNPAREEDALVRSRPGGRSPWQRISQPGHSHRRVWPCEGQQRRQRHSAAIGRILNRLHLRALVKKIAHTRLWRATERGRRIMGDTLRTYRR